MTIRGWAGIYRFVRILFSLHFVDRGWGGFDPIRAVVLDTCCCAFFFISLSWGCPPPTLVVVVRILFAYFISLVAVSLITVTGSDDAVRDAVLLLGDLAVLCLDVVVVAAGAS